MYHARPLNRPKVIAKRESRRVSSANGAPWPTSCSVSGGEQSPDQTPWRRVRVFPFDGLGAFQTRTIFSLPRRTSSGYFSSDSMPSSPLSPRSLTTDRATQTPSPSGQAMQHALERMAQWSGGRAGARAQQRHAVSGVAAYRSSRRPRITAAEMQEEEIGRKLRHIGDEFDGLQRLRRMEDHLPPIPQEPIVLLCIGLLLFVIVRKIYVQGSVDGQHHSQV